MSGIAPALAADPCGSAEPAAALVAGGGGAADPGLAADRAAGAVQGTPADAALAAAWAALAGVPDPELPTVSICDLGIVRAVSWSEGHWQVVLTPTYSGCPATEVIEQAARDALQQAGLGPVRITRQLAPAWTTDWITDEGRRQLRAGGIAPPARLQPDTADGVGAGGSTGRPHGAAPSGVAQPIRIHRPGPACPLCASLRTERLSAFGATACKALYRCLACREPFEHFKPI